MSPFQRSAREECDDGNRLDGDGCDSLCRIGDGEPPPEHDPGVSDYDVTGDPLVEADDAGHPAVHPLRPSHPSLAGHPTDADTTVPAVEDPAHGLQSVHSIRLPKNT